MNLRKVNKYLTNEKGIEQNKKQTAQKLLSKGLSIEEIFEITELSKKQIEELKKEIY